MIERKHNALTALFPHLKHTQEAAGVSDISSSIKVSNETLTIWDEIVDESVPGRSTTLLEPTPASDHAPDTGLMNIEEQIISLPSNGNVTDSYHDLELSYHMVHAEQHLTCIRDLISEKSFSIFSCYSSHTMQRSQYALTSSSQKIEP